MVKVDLMHLRQTYEELKKILHRLEQKIDQTSDIYRNLQSHTKGMEADIIEIGKVISSMREERYKIIELMVGIEKIHNCYQRNEKMLVNKEDEDIAYRALDFMRGYLDIKPINRILITLLRNRR